MKPNGLIILPLGVIWLGYTLAWFGYGTLKYPGPGLLDLIVPGRTVTFGTAATTSADTSSTAATSNATVTTV